METIMEYLTDYFADVYHVIFWVLVLLFSLYEVVKNRIRNSHRIKSWLKRHNIGKKYWF